MAFGSTLGLQCKGKGWKFYGCTDVQALVGNTTHVPSSTGVYNCGSLFLLVARAFDIGGGA